MAAISKETVLSLAALVTLASRLKGLSRVASRRGKKVVALQWALVGVALVSRKFRAALERIPSLVVPSLAVAALGVDLVAGSQTGRSLARSRARSALWSVIALGMVPELTEAVAQGTAAFTSGEADIPALIAMQLGLCLNQTRAAAVILLMLTGGEAFEDYALDHAGKALHSLLAQSPGRAHRVRADTGQLEDIDAERVDPGDLLLIKTGEHVPVDGVVEGMETRESPAFDESVLTGEHLPATKQTGERVMAGARLVGGACRIRATSRYQDSVVARMKAELAKALERKASLELESKRFVAFFTPLTFAFAALACHVSEWRQASPRRVWEAVLAVFMSATPCPAGIGVPIAMLSGMSVASHRFGATVKAGTALEGLAKVSTVVLDKTGTLTQGQPVVTSFAVTQNALKASSARTDGDLLRLVAATEQYSTHPLALAVCEYWKASEGRVAQAPHRGRELRLSAAQVDQHDGRGISAMFSEGVIQVRVGSRAYCMEDQRDEKAEAGDADIEAYFSVYEEGELRAHGRFTFQDQIRKSSRALVRKLRETMGLRVLMLSGDRSEHLSRVAKDVGIDEFSSCWPHEKAEIVSDLRAKGEVVLMVGDGANDSAALAAANVGMSVGAGNLAAESASVVLLNEEEIGNIADLIDLSKRVVHVATQTVTYGMSISLCLMGAAASGFTTPFTSAVAQECIDLGAVFSALRALR